MEWIPLGQITQMMPNDGQLVLVVIQRTDNVRELGLATFINDDWKCDVAYKAITHWAPILEMPNE